MQMFQKFKISLFATILSCSAINHAQADSRAEEVPAPIEKIFLPNGFDDNDNVEVVLFGVFPNSCYKTGQAGFHVDRVNKNIIVWATSYRYEQSTTMCAQVTSPFVQTVKLGFLAAGEYSVKLLYDQNKSGNLTVYKSIVESPDEFLYAPVEHVSSNFDNARNKQTVTLEGYYPRLYTGCMKIVDVRSSYDESGILVIRPISEIFPEQECYGEKYKFNVVKEIDIKLPRYTLIHTRVTNGNSLNNLVTDPEA